MSILGKLRFSNPDPSIYDQVTPQEVNLGFRTGFILEMRHARGRDVDLPSYIEQRVLVFAMNPQQYQLEEPFTVELTPVLGNGVRAEENGIILRNIVIEGTTGIKGRIGSGDPGAIGALRGGVGRAIGRDVGNAVGDVANAVSNIFKGDGGEQQGIKDHVALRAFFQNYSRGKKDPEVSRDLLMILHVLRDDSHFVVKPKSFSTPRDASTRIHYKYRIELTATSELDEKIPPIAGELGFEDVAQMVSEAFHDTRAAFAEMTVLTDVLKRKVANITAVSIQAAGVINSIGNLVNGFNELIDSPLQQVQLSTDILDNAADRLVTSITDPDDYGTAGGVADGSHKVRKISRALNLVLMNPDKFALPVGRREANIYAGEQTATNTDINNKTAGTGIGTRTRVLYGTGGYAGLSLGDLDSTITVRIRKGDTVQSLAQRHNSTPEGVVIVNNLRAPYITPDGGPGIKRPGDTVAIPISIGGVRTTAQSDDEYASVDDLVYGVDIRLDEALLERNILELSVDEKHGSTDFEFSRGIGNVVQGIAILIQTHLGATKFLPGIGIDREVGIKGTLQNMLFSSVRLRAAILSDPRIDGIESADIVLNGDKLEQEITPRVLGRANGVTLVVPYGTAAGE